MLYKVDTTHDTVYRFQDELCLHLHLPFYYSLATRIDDHFTMKEDEEKCTKSGNWVIYLMLYLTRNFAHNLIFVQVEPKS